MKTMKNKVFYFILLFLLSAKIQGQVTDTIFVYDKITVYDTVKIYDTIKVLDKNLTNSGGFENYFKKNKTAQSAVLAIDTATSKAALILYNGNDTAAISINSIILSEPNKNLETMKKEILTLAAASLLAQAALAQEGKTITAGGEEKIPAFNIGIGAILAFARDGDVQGFSICANKIRTKKLLLGISSDIGRIYFEGWKGNNYGAAVIGNTNGFYTNIFANASSYFMGNAVNSRAGLYGKLGLGATGYKTKQTVTFVGLPEENTYEATSLNFSAQLCIGGDVKLGRGRLFTEIVATPVIFGNYSYKASSSTSEVGYPYTWTQNPNITNGLEGEFGLRCGYVINF